MKRRWFGVVVVAAAAWGMGSASAADANLTENLAKVQAVASLGVGHREATAAAKELAKAKASELPQILAAMDDAGPIATNWLRGIAESVAQRAAENQGKLPLMELEKFLAETSHSPRARRLAFEILASADSNAPGRLIPTLLHDPSTELRREAVAVTLDEAAKQSETPAKIAAYRKAFQASRDLDQIKAAAAKLKELKEPVDLPTHMGYVLTWKLIGPFDNVDDKGWDVAYPPEQSIDLGATYDGQKGPVKWIDHTSTDDYGVVDLNKALNKHMGAVAYAYAEFIADRDRPAELRLGSANANKTWLNGQFLTANHVYHAGNSIDQYTAHGQLKRGKNIILVKICQNEQKDAWAQDWKFQLRVCDTIGTAILSQDRPLGKTATILRQLR